MKKFAEIKEQYRAKAITKPAFVNAMYDEHKKLFDYREHLSACNLEALEITRTDLIARFSDPAIRMVCPPGDVRTAPIEAFNFGDYERTEVQAARRIVEMLGGASARFLDVGANAGFYSLAFNHYFPGIKGVAFEPVPNTFNLLQKNFALNDVRNIGTENLGVSDKTGEITFHTYSSQSGASSMTKNLDDDSIEVRCQLTTLDAYCSTHQIGADFIKCDVEGAELFVFKGGKSLLSRDCPVVLCEMLRKWCDKFNYHPNEIISLLADLGYKCFSLKEGGLAPIEKVTAETAETNFVFLNTERHALIHKTMVR